MSQPPTTGGSAPHERGHPGAPGPTGGPGGAGAPGTGAPGGAGTPAVPPGTPHIPAPAAPPDPSAAPAPAQAGTSPGAPAPGGAPPGGPDGDPVAPPRQKAWREGLDQLRAAAVTEPGRLRIIGAVLAGVVLLFGALTVWQVADRQESADAVYERSQPLSAEAANIYRHLAAANTTAASGFLAGGKEPQATRRQYEKDIAEASRSLAKAASTTEGSARARAQIARLNERLPVYTGLIESARANNLQGLPLGGAYLRYANETMTGELLAAADELYRTETARLGADYRDAKTWPWAALAAGVLALGVLGWAQRRDYVRTNRVFNLGTLSATAACAALLLWLAVGHGVARAQLTDSDRHGAQSLRVLNEAQISALQARGAENLTLVARGADVVPTGPDKGKDAYEVDYREQMKRLTGGSGGGAAKPASLLARADALADDGAGRTPVERAVSAVREWQGRHTEALAASDRGDYDKALTMVIGRAVSTDESFTRADEALTEARRHEQAEFERAADSARGAFTGLAVGAGALAVVGALGAVLGIGRRLSEYR